MFVLIGFRKNGDTKVIAVNEDRQLLSDLAKRLFWETGLRDPSEGLWDRQEIKGRFWIEEIDENDSYQNGVDFLNYKL